MWQTKKEWGEKFVGLKFIMRNFYILKLKQSVKQKGKYAEAQKDSIYVSIIIRGTNEAKLKTKKEWKEKKKTQKTDGN